MNNKWNLYTVKLPILSDAGQIINALGVMASGDFYKSERSDRTKQIKIALINLGSKLGYKVYANRVDGLWNKIKFPFKSKEWLYDLHWYTESERTDDFFTPTAIQLAAEFEWDYKIKKEKINSNYKKEYQSIPFSAVKYDFQKLLITNASLRLLVFQYNRLEQLEEMKTYFENAIKNYNSIPQSSPFLFITFHMNLRVFNYLVLNK